LGHSAKAFNKRIFVLQKRAVRYIAGLKYLESCRNSFINLKILTVYSLYIQETILYVRKKCNFTPNEEIHITQEITKTVIDMVTISVVGCIFYNKLPGNVKQRESNNWFRRELKKLLKECSYSIEDTLNE
jgi:hypothetical protein